MTRLETWGPASQKDLPLIHWTLQQNNPMAFTVYSYFHLRDTAFHYLKKAVNLLLMREIIFASEYVCHPEVANVDHSLHALSA